VASFELVVTKRAEKELLKLGKTDIKRVDEKLLGLEKNPFQADTKKLSGKKHHYRVRVGTYRILYSVAGHVIRIEAIKHRREAYR